MEVILEYNGIMVQFKVNKNFPELRIGRNLLSYYFKEGVEKSYKTFDVIFRPTGKYEDELPIWSGVDNERS